MEQNNNEQLSNSGILAKTWDNREFKFYTMLQEDVENAMMLMGYDSHGYWLSMFHNTPEPETPFNFNFNFNFH